MRSIFFMLSVVIFCCLLMGQTGPPVYQSSQIGISSVSTSAPMNITGLGAVFHQLSWTVQGNVFSCSVQVDSSADAITWNLAAIIPSTTCTGGSQKLSSNITTNYIRVNTTVFSGPGAIVALLTGYSSSPSVGGLPPAGSGKFSTTTNLSNGGTPGVCAEWDTGGVLRSAASSTSCGNSSSTLPGIISATNPQTGNDPNNRRMVDFTVTTDSSTSNAGFTNESNFYVTENVTNGLALYSNAAGATRSKKTFIPLGLTGNMQGSGQKILLTENQNCYGMSDCFAESKQIYFAGGPITGDELQGFQAVSNASQLTSLQQSSLTGSPVRTTCNTTFTNAVTGSSSVQTYTVSSTTGCNVNDWVVLGLEAATGSPQETPMQITAIGSGTISGVSEGNFPAGATITPATVITLSMPGAFNWGQDRVLINLSQPAYTTGTVSSISGAGFTGSGTNWTNNMVGGTSPIVGCIALTPDDFSGPPFNGTGINGTLKSWYQIQQVFSPTSIGIFSWSVAQDAAYHGNGPGNGAYTIRPCAKVLKIVSQTILILETNSFTWTSGDSVEEAICPYPDMTGAFWRMEAYTAGGVRRSVFQLGNFGARQFQAGLAITGQMAPGGDTIPFDTGITVAGSNAGFSVGQPQRNAMEITTLFNQVTGAEGRIHWANNNGARATVGVNSTTNGLEINTISDTSPITMGSSIGSMVFGLTDPIVGTTNAPTGEYVGRFDAMNWNNATEPRFGLKGIGGNTWFIQTLTSSGRQLQLFNNNNGTGEGSGFGTVLSINSNTGASTFGGTLAATGGSANKVVCWKADGKTLGFCSTQPDATGACTCN